MKFKIEDGYFAFKCPGCKNKHYILIDGSRGWRFDGNMEAPTITPSLLETRGHYVTGQKQPPDCYICNREDAKEEDYTCGRCHLFVKAGKIEFCSDSTHALAGKTVDMPDFD